MQLDLIAAGGGESIFNISFWSKNSFINKINKIIIKYCLENNIQVEEGDISSKF
ncbi:hypothetical protein SAMN06296427_10719 [Moheibacter sediminis]|uniref:Uncharacterized protein n=1 Tax=Moheibacter sediminis TaxID=1434700 RepID=A0A1W2BP44_9FLAO|nr:hypothetical protein SAMN06296427_10719 [Moheibacter sediminis]